MAMLDDQMVSIQHHHFASLLSHPLGHLAAMHLGHINTPTAAWRWLLPQASGAADMA